MLFFILLGFFNRAEQYVFPWSDDVALMRQRDEEPESRDVISDKESKDMKKQGTYIISQKKLLLNLRGFYLTELTDNLF